MPNVWKIAPGEGASHWEMCLKESCILLGWKQLKDFMSFESEEEIVQELGGGPGDGKGAAQSVWRFAHDVKPSDIVIANRGRSIVEGIGVITGDYLPAEHPENPGLSEHLPHFRRVQWLISKPIELGPFFFGIPTVLSVNAGQIAQIRQAYEQKHPEFTTLLNGIFAGHVPTGSATIVILGMGDASSFKSADEFQSYIRGGVMSEEAGRFRYTKNLGQDPSVIVLSYEGSAYGHFVVHKGTPNSFDELRYKGTKSVYMVESHSDYSNPVRLSDIGLAVKQAPKYISQDDFEVILNAAGQVNTSNDDPSKESQRKRVLREIQQRQGQGQFRDALIKAYGTRCAITDCDTEQGLDAAHIRPYAKDGSDKTSNGLLLRSDIHNLFDLNLLAIDPATLTIHVADHLLKSTYGSLHGLSLKKPTSLADWPDVEALKERWLDFENKK